MSEGIVFLDRDGTILNLVYDTELKLMRGARNLDEFSFIGRSVEAICDLSKKFIVAVVTNQPDLARGKMSKVDFHMVNGNIARSVVEVGGKIDHFLHCPHTAEDDCGCRKPEIGMFTHVLIVEGVKSPLWVVGDSVCDVMAGKRLGAKTIQLAPVDGDPDYCASNLLEASKIILEQ